MSAVLELVARQSIQADDLRQLQDSDLYYFGQGFTRPDSAAAKELQRVAERFGCTFAQVLDGPRYTHAFVVHAVTVALPAWNALDVLIAAANRGLLDLPADVTG